MAFLVTEKTNLKDEALHESQCLKNKCNFWDLKAKRSLPWFVYLQNWNLKTISEISLKKEEESDLMVYLNSLKICWYE